MNKKTILSYKNIRELSKEVVELAQEIMPDKVIYINFLSDDVQVTIRVSKHDTNVNVKEGETIPVENALCNQIDYIKGEPMILTNVRANGFDEKVNKTIENTNLGSYLGIPIVLRNGQRFGALCAAHHDKGEFDEKDIGLLKSVAKLFTYYLELESLAYQDGLTGLHNTQYLETVKEEILIDGGLFVMLDLDCFKEVNDNFGHLVGDEVLKELGNKLSVNVANYENACAFRIGGDEFLIHIKDPLSDEEVKNILKGLVKEMSVWETPIGDIELSSSFGAVLINENSFKTFKELFQETDNLLYQAKDNGKKTYVFKNMINASK